MLQHEIQSLDMRVLSLLTCVLVILNRIMSFFVNPSCKPLSKKTYMK